ncbi:hypothetical protein QE152_g4875 [Popillia japonica]|uniref:Uncharacterized protein n=1 Tax=Popillia japonica TaxID=7064 RepID=A0AAW1MZG0_POPJA
MDSREEINRLSKGELLYELKILGVTTLTNVDEMRKTLRHLRKIEGNASFVRPKHPYTCDKDLADLNAKLAEIKELVDSFSGLPKSPEYSKVSTKLVHTQRRLGRCVPTTDEHRQQISKLLVELASLSVTLRSKAKHLVRSSTLNASVLDVTMGADAEGSESSDESGRTRKVQNRRMSRQA